MPLTFTPDQITGRSYKAESAAFVAAYGCTPRDATRTPEARAAFSPEVVELALFLDAWDVWLFSEEAEA